MIPAARAAGVLAVVAVVTGCSGGSPTAASPSPTASPTPSATSSVTASPSPTATTTPGPTPTRVTGPPRTATPATAVPPKGSKDFGYFTQVVSTGTEPVLRFDRAQFLTGDAANKAAAAHGDETPVPNDYYVVNDSTRLRELTLDRTVVVVGSSGLNAYAGDDGSEPKKRTVEDLLAFVDTEDGRATGFNLVYGEGGRVARVEEQFVP